MTIFFAYLLVQKLAISTTSRPNQVKKLENSKTSAACLAAYRFI